MMKPNSTAYRSMHAIARQAVFGCLIAAGNVHAGCPAHFEPRTIGPVSIGMNPKKLPVSYDLYPVMVTRAVIGRAEGDEPALRVRLCRSQSFLVETESSGKVIGMAIDNPSIRGPYGVGVGSTFKEIVNAYPSSVVVGGIEEESYLAVRVSEQGLAFAFDVAGLSEWTLKHAVTTSKELYDKRVTSVFIE